MSNMASVASMAMKLSLPLWELGIMQPSSGIHTERIWGAISPKCHDMFKFHDLPAQFLIPKQPHKSSGVHLQRKRPALDEESNVCYPYGGCKRQNDLIYFPNGDAASGATISSSFQKTNLKRERRTGRTREAPTTVMRRPTPSS
jgi:hypothetical protein